MKINFDVKQDEAALQEQVNVIIANFTDDLYRELNDAGVACDLDVDAFCLPYQRLTEDERKAFLEKYEQDNGCLPLFLGTGENISKQEAARITSAQDKAAKNGKVFVGYNGAGEEIHINNPNTADSPPRQYRVGLFNVGDVVQLKSGGVPMTVGEINPDKPFVIVQWLGEHAYQMSSATVPEGSLILIEKGEEE